MTPSLVASRYRGLTGPPVASGLGKTMGRCRDGIPITGAKPLKIFKSRSGRDPDHASGRRPDPDPRPDPIPMAVLGPDLGGGIVVCLPDAPPLRCDELLTRSAPRWAWDIIDETLHMDISSSAFDKGLREEIRSARDAMEDC